MTRTRAARDLDQACAARARMVAASFQAAAVRHGLTTFAADHFAEFDGGPVADAPELGFGEPLQKLDVVQ